VVKLDRVMFENIADEQTALSALQAGEIDFYEVPPQDLIDELKKDKNLTVEVLNKTLKADDFGELLQAYLHTESRRVHTPTSQ
jgi:ABC-type transport system substrate-binding protein